MFQPLFAGRSLPDIPDGIGKFLICESSAIQLLPTDSSLAGHRNPLFAIQQAVHKEPCLTTIKQYEDDWRERRSRIETRDVA
jgi:hypothetical protein